MTAIAKTSSNGVARQSRPLKELVPLIKSEIKLGFQAGQRHWLAVGRLLVEARDHFPKSGPNDKGLTFHEWVAENFAHPMTGEPLAEVTVRKWMQGARIVGDSSDRARAEPSVKSVTDNRSPNHVDYKPALDWQANVRKVQQSIDVEALAREAENKKATEREMRELAKKIIAAGYRALSAVVHPDKPGGSTEAMQKLTKAKKWLEEAIEQ